MKKYLIPFAAALLLVGCTLKERKQQATDADTNTAQTGIVAEGKEAPDFTLNDPDGMPLTLSSLHGQYVVLDFWGTWCKWCIKGIPDMKAYYEKYQGKFEILSIDIGDEEEAWRTAIESYEMEWLNVVTDEESANLLSTLYAIEDFPTKIIIDPDGKVLKIWVGEDPAFYQYLDDLFGAK